MGIDATELLKRALAEIQTENDRARRQFTNVSNNLIDDSLKKARIALNALAAQQDAWQPIETAPADTPLLLAWGAVSWDFGECSIVVDMAKSTRGGWEHGRATHWRPLPAPPQS